MTKEQTKTVLVMAGGTGGHVFPAMATARCLEDMGFAIRWLGTKAGIEADVVPKAGLDISYVNVTGLRGKGIGKLITAPLLLMRALWQSMQIIRAVQPVAVLGMGGFVTGPAGLAAKLLGKPLVIHEQNAIAGMTNRYLAKMANAVLLAFPNAIANADKVTGNPIRQEISALEEPETRFAKRQDEQQCRVLILGGSLGALALNETMPKVLQTVAEDLPLSIIHQCGKKHAGTTEAVYTSATKDNLDIEVKPFIDDMAAAYAWADIVICRSGALTVSELTAVGVGAILVPFPFAVDDHQTKNAEFLANEGAGRVVQQKDIDAAQLAAELKTLLSDKEKLLAMAKAARSLARPDATQAVAEVVAQAAGGKS